MQVGLTSRPTSRQKLAAEISLFVLLSFMAALAFHYYAGVLGRGYPLNNFLFRPDDAFRDFLNIFDSLKDPGGPYGTRFKIGYSPLVLIFIKCFSFLSDRIELAIVALVFIWSVWRIVRANTGLSTSDNSQLQCLIPIVLLTYPVLFALDRGNVEMIAFCFISAFAAALVRGKFRTAAICLAFAVSVKFYFIVYAMLLMRQKRHFAAAILLSALGLIVGFLAIDVIYGHPVGAAALAFLRDIGAYSSPEFLDVPPANFFQHSHTIWSGFASVKLLSINTSRPITVVGLHYHLAKIVSMLIFAFLVGCATFSRLADWKRFALCTVAILICPLISYDYTLINWLIAVNLFVGADNEPLQHSRVFWLVMSIPLVPMDYFQIYDVVTSSSLIYPLGLLCIAIYLTVPLLKACHPKLLFSRRTAT